MNTDTKILAWHWVKDDATLRDGTPLEVGKTYTMDGEPELCSRGFHASEKILDALEYAPGSLLCRVEVGGTVIQGNDKLVGTERRVLWLLDCSNLLHEFACRCAEDALKLVENPDPRSVAAIEAKRQWVKGEITDDELAAAGVAARVAQGQRLVSIVEEARAAQERDIIGWRLDDLRKDRDLLIKESGEYVDSRGEKWTIKKESATRGHWVWNFTHDEYTGDEDDRCGWSGSISECVEAIEEIAKEGTEEAPS